MPRSAWLVLGLLGCSNESLLPEQKPAVPPLAEPLGSSVAGPGKVRLFVGQDLTSIADYARDVAPVVGAVSYTSLARLEGLSQEHDSGGGPMHLDQLAARYPGQPLSLGLYLVDDLTAINQGLRDQAILELGQRLGSYRVPVLVRVGYEFDIDWSGYDPDQYRRAFVRIAQGLRAEAEQVELVWQSAASCDTSTATRQRYYPGDEYVDWVAVSFFSQSRCALQPLLDLVGFARQHHKAFFIAEATPQGFDLGDGTFSQNGRQREPADARISYAQWFEPFFDFVHRHTDVVRGVTYINSDWDTQPSWAPPYENGYFGDSRVQADPEIERRWLSELESPLWIAGI